MSGVGARQMILALQVGLGDLEIMQGHVGTFVAEEFHAGGQGDAGAQHLRGICVAHLVRDDVGVSFAIQLRMLMRWPTPNGPPVHPVLTIQQVAPSGEWLLRDVG